MNFSFNLTHFLNSFQNPRRFVCLKTYFDRVVPKCELAESAHLSVPFYRISVAEERTDLMVISEMNGFRAVLKTDEGTLGFYWSITTLILAAKLCVWVQFYNLLLFQSRYFSITVSQKKKWTVQRSCSFNCFTALKKMGRFWTFEVIISKSIELIFKSVIPFLSNRVWL